MHEGHYSHYSPFREGGEHFAADFLGRSPPLEREPSQNSALPYASILKALSTVRPFVELRAAVFFALFCRGAPTPLSRRRFGHVLATTGIAAISSGSTFSASLSLGQTEVLSSILLKGHC